MKTRVDTLELVNFRSFRDLSISFHPELTVLVAPNGGGKTAILDGLSVALYQFVDTICGDGESHGFTSADVRIGRDPAAGGEVVPFTPTTLRARANIDNHDIEWKCELAKVGGQTSHVHANEIIHRSDQMLKALQAYADRTTPTPPVFPVIAYYGTGRLWNTHKVMTKKKQVAEDLRFQTGAYADCLSSSSTYTHFTVWFERVIREALNEQQSGRASPHRPQLMLEAMRGAIDTVLEPSGWHRLDWDLIAEEMVVEHSERGSLSVDLLSDGIRNLVGFVADLAHRAVRLNPQFRSDACTMSPGIVLIDEVDMHLHPKWQQLVVGQLRKAFPRMQFVVTTRSPQVLSTVDKDCIRVIRMRDGVATSETPKFQTRGVDSSDVLSYVMGVQPVPQVEEAQLLSEYRARIEDYKAYTPEALEMRQRLIAHFGDHHPLMTDCDTRIRFQDFKVLRNASDIKALAERAEVV